MSIRFVPVLILAGLWVVSFFGELPFATAGFEGTGFIGSSTPIVPCDTSATNGLLCTSAPGATCTNPYPVPGGPLPWTDRDTGAAFTYCTGQLNQGCAPTSGKVIQAGGCGT